MWNSNSRASRTDHLNSILSNESKFTSWKNQYLYVSNCARVPLVKIRSQAVLRISQCILLFLVIVLTSWTPMVSYAGGYCPNCTVLLNNALKITVIPPYESVYPGGTISVTVIVSNPSSVWTFIATSCLLWEEIPQAGLGWTLVNPQFNAAYCLPSSQSPHYFPPSSVEVWVFTQYVSQPLAKQTGTVYFKLLAVGYDGNMGLGNSSFLYPATSQWAYFTLTAYA